MAIERFTVSRSDEHYQAWPCLARTDAGRLVCVFSQCRHHGDRSFARFVVCHSDDDGATWSPPRVVVDTSAIAGEWWNCARIVQLRDGRLAIAGDRVKGGERTDERNLTNWLWFSSDAGETWDGPHPTGVLGIVPDKLLELASGRWLLAAHHHSPTHGFLEQRAWWSDDRGATWQGPAMIASQAGLNLCEASLLPLDDEGGLVAFMRENSGKGLDAYKSFSLDGGQTWAGPYPTVLCGCHRPVAGWLPSGRCLVTYRFLQGGRGGWGRATQNFFGAVMGRPSVLARERNRQWARIRPIDFDASAQSDIGYSGWVNLPGGRIYIVTYLLDDWPRGQIRGYRLREEDFGAFADE